jgi:histidinol-phosphate aminotransferase
VNLFGKKASTFTSLSGPLVRLDYADCKYPPCDEVKRAIIEELNRINLYPDENYGKLREEIAIYNNVKKENILVSNGSDELIDLIIRVFGKTVLIPIPTFSQYERFARINGSEIILRNCLENGYSIKFTEDDLKRATLIFVCNPNNPTGNLIPKEEISRIIKNTDAVVAVDECYFEYCGVTCSDLIEECKNLVILRSLSKTFALAGLRLGYAISNDKIIQKLEKIKQVFNVNRLAEVAGITSLRNLSYYRNLIKKIESNRYKLERFLKKKKINVFPSYTNFLLIKLKNEKEGMFLYKELKKRGIYVFLGSSPDFSGLDNSFIRITIGTEKENDYLLKNIKEICK